MSTLFLLFEKPSPILSVIVCEVMAVCVLFIGFRIVDLVLLPRKVDVATSDDNFESIPSVQPPHPDSMEGVRTPQPRGRFSRAIVWSATIRLVS